MNSIEASGFQAQCLQLMDEVVNTGEPLFTTKNDKPVATLLPSGGKRQAIAGLHAGPVQILGDIVSPAEEPWEAMD